MTAITGGQSLICSGSVSFGATGFPINGQWKESTNLILSSTSSTGATVTKNGSGAAWIKILDGSGQEVARRKEFSHPLLFRESTCEINKDISPTPLI